MNYKLLPHQDDFVFSAARYVLQSGGVGSGKTYSIVLKTLKLIAENPGIFILIGAQTYPLLRDTTLREFLSLIPDEMIKSYHKTNNHFIFRNGSEVIFRAFDDESKLKSLNMGAVGIEEMTDVKEDIFKMLRTRLRQPAMPHCLYGATNPDTFGNYVYKNFIENPIDGSQVIYSSSANNKFLPEEYLKDLETMKNSNPEYYARMVEGKWGSLEGVIYSLPMKQRRSLDNYDILRRAKRVISGLDFGFQHPTAFVIVAQIEDTFFVLEELYERKLTSQEITSKVKAKCKEFNIEAVYCDYSRPEIIEDLRRAGVPALDAIKDVFDGIMYVKSLIGSGNLIVSTNCTYTLREFDSYIWDSKNTIKEQPIKVNDDCMDALRYALFSSRNSFEFFGVRPDGNRQQKAIQALLGK